MLRQRHLLFAGHPVLLGRRFRVQVRPCVHPQVANLLLLGNLRARVSEVSSDREPTTDAFVVALFTTNKS